VDIKTVVAESSYRLKSIIDRIGFARLNLQYLSLHDFNRDGIDDIEIAADNSYFLQSSDGFTANEKRASLESPKLECRKQASPSNSSRQIIKMGGFKSESLVTFLKTSSSTETKLYLCDLDGQLKQELRIEGAFGPDPRTRLADLDHDGKPDLIRVLAGTYQVSKNLSQDGVYQFGPVTSYPLAKDFDASRGIYIEDINGDGFVDLVSFKASQLVYAPGKGRMQFGPELVRTPILNKENKTLNFTGFELYFIDANRDGLADLFGIKNNRFSLFMNVGSHYQELDLSYLQPKISYTKYLYGDLLGKGLPDLLQAQYDGSVKVLSLTQAHHGLLRTIRDGLGNVMELNWGMAPPMFKAGERAIVLKGTLVKSYGDGELVFENDYKAPVVSSDGRRFLGFQDTVQKQKHKIKEHHYIHNDDAEGILKIETTRDSRRPDVSFSSQYEYEDQNYYGLPWKALKARISGFHGAPADAHVIKYETWSDYNENLCPQSLALSAEEQSEVKTMSFWSAPDDLKSMTCFENHVRISPSFQSNSQFEWEIKRSTIGLIESIEQKTRDESLILQSLDYDADHRIEMEAYPDGRFLRLKYMGKTLVVEHQTAETGREISLPGMSELDSLPRTKRLTTEDKHFDLALTWDAEERLETLFYRDFPDTPGNSHIQYTYRLSKNEQLGVLEEKRVHSDGSRSTLAKVFSANGLELAQMARLDMSYSIGGLIKSHAADQKLEPYAMRNESLDLERLTLEDLMGDSAKLGSSEKDAFSFLLDAWKTFEDGVSGNENLALTVEDGLLKMSGTRNSELDQVKWYDSAMRLKKMQLGQKLIYRFNYDWHGRFESITMPQGEVLTVVYDDFGRKKIVKHSKLGAREFIYKQHSGLIETILVKSAQEERLRSTSFQYDEKARVIEQIHQSNGKSKTFRQSYDGNMGFGEMKNHQLGFQTGERGDEYSTNTAYSVDGKVLKQEQVYSESVLLSQNFEYDWDGFTKIRRIQLKELNGARGLAYELRQTRDALGRLDHLYLDQNLLLSFEYDDLGRLDKVIDSSGRVMSPQYDKLTSGLKGWESAAAQQRLGYGWHYDDRGLIASESFVSSMTKIFDRR
ncbi:MAG: VCBS repeat-containing protein, partial [Proteobacteria bacterium]|nr:VCBS repeat-containing protein [Pseudomonadota bacterium]